MNVKIIFLYNDIQKNIYIQQFDDFNKNNIKVCKLNKIFYNLKQSFKI